MRGKSLFALIGFAVLGTLACVKVPGEVETQFAPKSALEESHFNKRSGAPLAHTFLTGADLTLGDAGVNSAQRLPPKPTHGGPTDEELDAEHQRTLEVLGLVPSKAPASDSTPAVGHDKPAPAAAPVPAPAAAPVPAPAADAPTNRDSTSEGGAK